MCIRYIDTPRGRIPVQALGYDRDGWAKVQPLKAGSTSFTTQATRLHKPE